MSENISTDTARIRAMKTSIVSLLETERATGVPATRVEQGAQLLVESYQDLFNEGSKQLVKPTPESFGATLQAIEASYSDWRAVNEAFCETLALAYDGHISRDHLLLDRVHSELVRRVGEPITALYARLFAAWGEHLESAPWDNYVTSALENADFERLDGSVQSLVHGDHLDVEDAIVELTGPLRYAFASYLESRTDSLEMLEESLWMRPEIIVMSDYWKPNPRIRLLDVLRRKGDSKLHGAFLRVQDYFCAPAALADTRAPEQIVADVAKIRPEERETYLRCLTLHPDQQIRRYAVSNIDIEGLWKVITPQAVPCATILSLLERVAGSQNYDENFQKIFFQTIHRRLLSLGSRTEVFYARGIVRIFTRLPFFMEDEYFEKLQLVIDYLAAKEKAYGVRDGVLDEYVSQIRHEKDRIGTLQAQSPSLTTIPPVVLRKLARDGHFWFELAMHPMFKIARETIRHIKSQDRALRVANNHTVNQDVLREIGRNRGLFGTHVSKIALLSNPRTPVSVSLGYLMDLSRGDIEQLLRKSTVHPELRHRLQKRLTIS